MQTIRQDLHEEIFRDLIRINSSHPEGNEMDVVKYILSHIEGSGLEHKVLDHGGNRGSLVVKINGKRMGATAFIGHIDTVAVNDASEWKYPPFEGQVIDGHMYGRGTSDMKGGVAAMIITIKHILDNCIVPENDLFFVFTADEEKDGMGMKAVIEEGLIDGVEEIFITEPTELGIGIKEKGALWISFEALGKASHASRPDLGVNSVEAMIEFFSTLKKRLPEKYDEMLGSNTAQITMFNGGVQTNILPDYAKAVMDMRSVSDNFDEVMDIIRRTKAEVEEAYPGLELKHSVENHRPYLEIDRKDGFVKKIEALYEKLGREVSFEGINFYTDASQAVPHFKVPFVVLGPGYGEMCHKRDEMAKVSQIVEAAQIYVNYVCGQ